MPLQAGSNAVLKKMFRGYTKEQYLEFVDNIRALNRDISITTDIIVGFCDETEEDFQESLEVTRYSKFDMIYIGIYSPRPGTYGAKKYEDNVPMKVKKERRARLNQALNETSKANNKYELGRQRAIMVREVEAGKIS
jgi:tRNA-2-methylthio-N6-dimethylallyladenosine synthase